MAHHSYSNLNRRDRKYELGPPRGVVSKSLCLFRCFLALAPLPFERASLAALTVDAGNSDLRSINEREGISSNRNPPAFSTRSLTADVMSFQFWNLVCSRTHMVCTAPALPSTIEMCNSLRTYIISGGSHGRHRANQRATSASKDKGKPSPASLRLRRRG